jgi:hypothetical protein
MLAFVAVAQKVVAEPRARAAASPPSRDPLVRLAVEKTRAVVAAAVMAENAFTRHAGVGPSGMWAKSQASSV